MTAIVNMKDMMTSTNTTDMERGTLALLMTPVVDTVTSMIDMVKSMMTIMTMIIMTSHTGVMIHAHQATMIITPKTRNHLMYADFKMVRGA